MRERRRRNGHKISFLSSQSRDSRTMSFSKQNLPPPVVINNQERHLTGNEILLRFDNIRRRHKERERERESDLKCTRVVFGSI